MKRPNRTPPAPLTDFAAGILDLLDALYGYAMALTRQRWEAEDLVQETCLRALDHRHQFHPDSDLKAWLFVMLRRLWLNHLRRTRRGLEITGLEPDFAESIPAGIEDDPQVLYLREGERQRVRDALRRLPPEFREIIVLRDLEEFSYRQIAELVGCPMGTVMSRLARARARLKQLLNETETQGFGKTWAEEHH